MSERKLRELIEGISVAMLTTVDAEGQLRSRPLATLQVDGDNELWFFTASQSPKADEIAHDSRVNLSYANEDDHTYVSVSGNAEIVRDPMLIHRLWKPVHKAWFPEGPDDPNLVLLKVTALKAEYWDSPGSAVVNLVGMAKALVTGQPYRPGENEKLTLQAH